MSLIEVKVPDIGDFKEVEIIELLVKVGDTIKVDQSLITVESDKASMEIPSSHAGVVQGVESQARRQGGRRLAAADCWKRSGERSSCCAAATAPAAALHRCRRASCRSGTGASGSSSSASCGTSAGRR